MFNEYLNVVKTCIKNKRLHGEICDELESHLQAEKDFYMEIGYDETTAELKAVEAMGDPAEMGENMAKLHELSTGAKVIIALFCTASVVFAAFSQICMALIFAFETLFCFDVFVFILLLAFCTAGLFLADRYNRRLPAVMSLVTLILSLSYILQFSVDCGAFASYPLERAVYLIMENKVMAFLFSPVIIFIESIEKDWIWENDFFGTVKDVWNENIVPNALMWVIATIIFVALTVLLVWITVRIIAELKHYNSTHGVRAKTMKILLLVLGVCVIMSAVIYTKGCEYERNVQEKNQNCAEMIFDAVQQEDYLNWSFEDFKEYFSDYECTYDETECEFLYTASSYGAEYKYHRNSLYTNNETGEQYFEPYFTSYIEFETAIPAFFSFDGFFSEDEKQKAFDDYIHHSSLIGKDADELFDDLKKFRCDSIVVFKTDKDNKIQLFMFGYYIEFADRKVSRVEFNDF